MSCESVIFHQDVFLHFILKVKKKHLKDRLVINSLINADSKAHQNFDEIQHESTYSLIQELQNGGKIIYMRHATTKTDWADQASAGLSLDDCSTQRELSTAGKLQATQIGNSLRNHKVPIGRVISSEYCRAIDTAQLSFGEHETNKALNFLPCEVCTEGITRSIDRDFCPCFPNLSIKNKI
jgi:hypothetical protein